ALGRLTDAAAAIQVASERSWEIQDWSNTATDYGNLSEILLSLGNVSGALGAARKAIYYSDRCRDEALQANCRCLLADILHQAGNLAESARLFQEGERLQTKA